MIQGIIFIIFFIFLLLEYKKNPQRHVLVTLVALILVALTRVVFVNFNHVGIKSGLLGVTLVFCVLSFYLIKKQEK